MTEYDYWKIFPRMSKKVTMGDITVRDGFQHLEKFISTRVKIFYAEELIFAGCRNIEVTNLGNPYLMPQFSDAEEVLGYLRSDRFRSKCAKRGIDYDDICITAVTIREKSVDRAIEFVLALQTEHGDIHWKVNGDGVPEEDALVTGCSSIYKSLECAHNIAVTLDQEQPAWLDAALQAGEDRGADRVVDLLVVRQDDRAARHEITAANRARAPDR